MFEKERSKSAPVQAPRLKRAAQACLTRMQEARLLTKGSVVIGGFAVAACSFLHPPTKAELKREGQEITQGIAEGSSQAAASAAASRASAAAAASLSSAEASTGSTTASSSSAEASASPTSASPTPTPTPIPPETTAAATTTASRTTATTAASPKPSNFIPTEVNFSRLASPDACQQGGSSGENLVPLVTPECDGQSLLTNESAGPKVGQTVMKVCYIKAGDNGTDNVWAVIKTSPDWAEPDRSGQAANGGFIGVVPAAALLDQNPMALCPAGYDTSGFPSVNRP